MRQVTPRRAHPRIVVAALLAVALVLLALAAPAVFASSEPAASGSPAADEAAAPASPAASTDSSPAPADASPDAVAASPTADPVPPVLTCTLDHQTVIFADTVVVSGTLAPPGDPGQQVDVTLDGKVVGSATTDETGAWQVQFVAHRGGSVVATLTADPTVVSPAQTLSVKVKAGVSHSTLVPFLKASFVVKVAPLAYDGVVTVKVVHRRVVVGRYRARVRDGRATFAIPLRGVDGFTLTFALPASGGLAARTLETKIAVKARTLSAGASGPYVKGMLTGLQRLAVHIPGMGSSFTTSVKDSVMAFQKAYRLSRTYIFNTACWRKMDGAKVIKPRHASPSTHIEVDKGRQILMIVKDGKVFGLICVSTGATNNTPEGSFHIQQKHPFTTSGFGGILVRTMGFIGDFAIHGYSPVPPYPASHGCVREPIWACYWTYDQSWVGEALYIYH